MRTIVVTKLGNEPNLFGNDLRYGMLGEWECLKLLKILSDDKDNNVFYYGKAKWNEEKAKEYFTNEVTYLDSSLHNPETLTKMAMVDEFHVVLGPHAFYNGGKNIPAWESIKSSLVTQRLLDRVAPQINLMNINSQANIYCYLSDRRFLLQTADLENENVEIFAQSFKPKKYDRVSFDSDDYTYLDTLVEDVEPFRFETLWLYGKSYGDYCDNLRKAKHNTLVIPANQVTSDAEIENSRFKKIANYVQGNDNFVICGKWTHPEARKFFNSKTNEINFLDGLEQEEYSQLLESSRYALVTFNTKDGPKIFENNWLTVKYWECVYSGCLTFVEGDDDTPFIPRELIVQDAKELQNKLQQCDEDYKYYNRLMTLQNNLVKPEYFLDTYFNTFIKDRRFIND